MKDIFKKIKTFFKNEKVQDVMLWMLVAMLFLGCIAVNIYEGITDRREIIEYAQQIEPPRETEIVTYQVIDEPKETVKEEPEPSLAEPYREAAVYVAKTVYGEARGLSITEQAAVVWCILNRTDERNTQTPEDVIKVVTAKGQFHGYKKSQPCTDEHLALAMDVIERWLREKDGETDVGRVLPKEYTFFAGRGGHNYFRDGYKSRKYWDWSLPSPYGEIDETPGDYTWDNVDIFDMEAMDRSGRIVYYLFHRQEA